MKKESKSNIWSRLFQYPTDTVLSKTSYGREYSDWPHPNSCTLMHSQLSNSVQVLFSVIVNKTLFYKHKLSEFLTAGATTVLARILSVSKYSCWHNTVILHCILFPDSHCFVLYVTEVWECNIIGLSQQRNLLRVWTWVLKMQVKEEPTYLQACTTESVTLVLWDRFAMWLWHFVNTPAMHWELFCAFHIQDPTAFQHEEHVLLHINWK